MAQTSLDKLPSSQLAQTIELSWSNQTRRYVSWNDSVTVSGVGTFTSDPLLFIEYAENHGGTADKPHTVTMDRRVEPSARLVSGYSHAPVTVVLGEVDPSAPNTTYRIRSAGRLLTGTRNPSGSANLARFKVGTIKSKLASVRLGWTTQNKCVHKFGDANCGVDLAPLRQTGTIVAVSFPVRTAVQVSFSPADSRLLYWLRGYIEVEGLRIMIRNVDAGSPFVFDLVRVPPPWWTGKTFTVTPGCAKQVSICRDIWNNLNNFNAPGISIPAYNPTFSTS